MHDFRVLLQAVGTCAADVLDRKSKQAGCPTLVAWAGVISQHPLISFGVCLAFAAFYCCFLLPIFSFLRFIFLGYDSAVVLLTVGGLVLAGRLLARALVFPPSLSPIAISIQRDIAASERRRLLHALGVIEANVVVACSGGGSMRRSEGNGGRVQAAPRPATPPSSSSAATSTAASAAGEGAPSMEAKQHFAGPPALTTAQRVQLTAAMDVLQSCVSVWSAQVREWEARMVRSGARDGVGDGATVTSNSSCGGGMRSAVGGDTPLGAVGSSSDTAAALAASHANADRMRATSMLVAVDDISDVAGPVSNHASVLRHYASLALEASKTALLGGKGGGNGGLLIAADQASQIITALALPSSTSTSAPAAAAELSPTSAVTAGSVALQALSSMQLEQLLLSPNPPFMPCGDSSATSRLLVQAIAAAGSSLVPQTAQPLTSMTSSSSSSTPPTAHANANAPAAVAALASIYALRHLSAWMEVVPHSGYGAGLSIDSVASVAAPVPDAHRDPEAAGREHTGNSSSSPPSLFYGDACGVSEGDIRDAKRQIWRSWMDGWKARLRNGVRRVVRRVVARGRGPSGSTSSPSQSRSPSQFESGSSAWPSGSASSTLKVSVGVDHHHHLHPQHHHQQQMQPNNALNAGLHPLVLDYARRALSVRMRDAAAAPAPARGAVASDQSRSNNTTSSNNSVSSNVDVIINSNSGSSSKSMGMEPALRPDVTGMTPPEVFAAVSHAVEIHSPLLPVSTPSSTPTAAAATGSAAGGGASVPGHHPSPQGAAPFVPPPSSLFHVILRAIASAGEKAWGYATSASVPEPCCGRSYFRTEACLPCSASTTTTTTTSSAAAADVSGLPSSGAAPSSTTAAASSSAAAAASSSGAGAVQVWVQNKADGAWIDVLFFPAHNADVVTIGNSNDNGKYGEQGAATSGTTALASGAGNGPSSALRGNHGQPSASQRQQSDSNGHVTMNSNSGGIGGSSSSIGIHIGGNAADDGGGGAGSGGGGERSVSRRRITATSSSSSSASPPSALHSYSRFASNNNTLYAPSSSISSPFPAALVDCCTGDGVDRLGEGAAYDDDRDADETDEDVAGPNGAGSVTGSNSNSTRRICRRRRRHRRPMASAATLLRCTSSLVNIVLRFLHALVGSVASILGLAVRRLGMPVPSWLTSMSSSSSSSAAVAWFPPSPPLPLSHLCSSTGHLVAHLPPSSSSSTSPSSSIFASRGPLKQSPHSRGVTLYCSPNAAQIEYAHRGNEMIDWYRGVMCMDVVVWNYRGYGRSGIVPKAAHHHHRQRDLQHDAAGPNVSSPSSASAASTSVFTSCAAIASESSTSASHSFTFTPSESPRPALIRSDVETMLHWLQYDCGATAVIVHGESLGGIAACHAASISGRADLQVQAELQQHARVSADHPSRTTTTVTAATEVSAPLIRCVIADRTFDTLPRTGRAMMGAWAEHAVTALTGWTRSNAEAMMTASNSSSGSNSSRNKSGRTHREVNGQVEEDDRQANPTPHATVEAKASPPPPSASLSSSSSMTVTTRRIVAVDTHDGVITWDSSLASGILRRMMMMMRMTVIRGLQGMKASRRDPPLTSRPSYQASSGTTAAGGAGTGTGAAQHLDHRTAIVRSIDEASSRLYFLLQHVARLAAPRMATQSLLEAAGMGNASANTNSSASGGTSSDGGGGRGGNGSDARSASVGAAGTGGDDDNGDDAGGDDVDIPIRFHDVNGAPTATASAAASGGGALSAVLARNSLSHVPPSSPSYNELLLTMHGQVTNAQLDVVAFVLSGAAHSCDANEQAIAMAAGRSASATAAAVSCPRGILQRTTTMADYDDATADADVDCEHEDSISSSGGGEATAAAAAEKAYDDLNSPAPIVTAAVRALNSSSVPSSQLQQQHQQQQQAQNLNQNVNQDRTQASDALLSFDTQLFTSPRALTTFGPSALAIVLCGLTNGIGHRLGESVAECLSSSGGGYSYKEGIEGVRSFLSGGVAWGWGIQERGGRPSDAIDDAAAAAAAAGSATVAGSDADAGAAPSSSASAALPSSRYDYASFQQRNQAQGIVGIGRTSNYLLTARESGLYTCLRRLLAMKASLEEQIAHGTVPDRDGSTGHGGAGGSGSGAVSASRAGDVVLPTGPAAGLCTDAQALSSLLELVNEAIVVLEGVHNAMQSTPLRPSMPSGTPPPASSSAPASSSPAASEPKATTSVTLHTDRDTTTTATAVQPPLCVVPLSCGHNMPWSDQELSLLRVQLEAALQQ